jgi:beta-glucanase (GH16 family)
LARACAGHFFTTTMKISISHFTKLALIGAIATSNSFHAQTTWQLIWSDEFSGNALNTGNWSYEFGNGGWGNNEWQYYTNWQQNIEVLNGNLKITARHEGVGATEYTSARIISKGLFDFQYGKIEARMKLPLGQGLWPAFWMLGANIDEVSWPECGEIDIMEHVNNELMTHGTVHWFNNGHSYVGNGYSVDPTQYHVYGVIWDENLIRWFVDGVQFYQFTIQAPNNSDDAFRHPMFLLLNMAIGGNWPGYPDATTPFPSSMLVDYVRVYQPAALDVAEGSLRFDVSVYPNPTNSFVAVESSFQVEECTLLDMTGRALQYIVAPGQQFRIDLNAVESGVYLLECNSKGQRITRTIVVE